jgi:hypothetical protein
MLSAIILITESNETFNYAPPGSTEVPKPTLPPATPGSTTSIPSIPTTINIPTVPKIPGFSY